MSPRITRSAARLAADSPSSAGSGPSSIPAAGSAPTRKRKAHARRDPPLDVPEETNPQSPTRRTKRQRLASPPHPASTVSTSRRGTRNRPAMSQQGYVMGVPRVVIGSDIKLIFCLALVRQQAPRRKPRRSSPHLRHRGESPADIEEKYHKVRHFIDN